MDIIKERLYEKPTNKKLNLLRGKEVVPRSEMQKRFARRVGEFRVNLNAIIDMAQRLKIERIVLGSIPVDGIFKKKNPDLSQFFLDINTTMRDVAKKRGVGYVDVKTFIENLPNRNKLFSGPHADPIHVDEGGMMIIARLFCDSLVDFLADKQKNWAGESW